MAIDIREEIRKHDSARFFALEALRGLLELIRQTRPDTVLGLTKKEMEEGGSQVDLREWNQDWVNNARQIITKLWEGGQLLATDVIKVMEEVTGVKSEGTSENK